MKPVRKMRKTELVAVAILVGADFRHNATKRELWAAIQAATA